MLGEKYEYGVDNIKYFKRSSASFWVILCCWVIYLFDDTAWNRPSTFIVTVRLVSLMAHILFLYYIGRWAKSSNNSPPVWVLGSLILLLVTILLGPLHILAPIFIYVAARNLFLKKGAN